MQILEQPKELAAAETKKEKPSLPEYLVISDKNSKILLSTTDFIAAKSLASAIAQAGGFCTLFKSIK